MSKAKSRRSRWSLDARPPPQARRAVATAAWYRKSQPTFADTLAAVRRQFWQEKGFFTSYLTAVAQNLNRHSTKPLPTPSAMPHSTE